MLTSYKKLPQPVNVRVRSKELLVAVKLHSGRLTDARDPIALINDIDLDDVAIHNE
jgi:hypothetical protein